MPDPITLNPLDDVAILTEASPMGSRPLGEGLPLAMQIEAGHKIAKHAIPKGNAIHKFGQIIAYATTDIAKGAHVHSHNCEIGVHDQAYEVGVDLNKAKDAIPSAANRTFMGYKRSNGKVGTRNMIALCATVNCSATVIKQAAERINQSGILSDYPNIDGIATFAHGSGCGMKQNGPGWDNLQRVLWGHATHANVGAAIFVGLGCEAMQIKKMEDVYESGGNDQFYGLTIQETGGTRKTIEHIVAKVKELLPEINQAERSVCPASKLTLALQCGGSDGYSGITANPALGVAADLLVGLGGTAILAETPEIYGAEQLLLRRAASTEIADKLIERIKWWEHYTKINNGSMDNNPSPGNKAGGLTTILEKSLGAVAKGGTTPLNQVLEYGQQVTESGFVFMDSPGYDPTSITGQIASGANIVAFTTGRGSAYGSKPAPTIKLATNDHMYQRMTEDMDINCGDIVTNGVTTAEKGEEILDYLLAIASGQKSKSEALGLGDHEFVPWQIDAVM